MSLLGDTRSERHRDLPRSVVKWYVFLSLTGEAAKLALASNMLSLERGY
jgi:hypothetical protein